MKNGITKNHRNKSHSLKFVETEASVVVLLSEVECMLLPTFWLFNNSTKTSNLADWALLGSGIEIHEQSKTHAIASEVYYRWKVELTVDGQNLAEIKNATDHWEKVLRCHFDSSN